MARFPKGVRKAIDQYGDRIAERIGLWPDWTNPLGCGSFGCVFPLWNKDVRENEPASPVQLMDKVLKISTDPTEGPVVSAIMKTGRDKILDGLSRWYGVWRIPEPIQEGPRGTAWVILREDVNPLVHQEVFQWNRYPKWLTTLRQYNEIARKAITLKTEWKAKKAWEDAGEYIGELYNRKETYYIAEAIEELARYDIILADIHDGNLGFRTHESDEQDILEVTWFDGKERPPLLIFDPGHSSSPEGTTVENLWALGSARNPWLEGEAEEIPEI